MSGVVHVLSASITSALAVKPSTVYVLRIENTVTRNVWHIRRCFSEFCDLRDKMIVLIEGQSSSSHGNNGSTGSAQSSPTPTSRTAMRLLSLKSSLSPSSSATNSPRATHVTSAAGTGPVQQRYPFLYTKFPRRQFFGSRTTKVIEQRTLALNQFLQEALWFIRELKSQHHIAVYFSLMTQLEVFFDCARHFSSSSSSVFSSCSFSTSSSSNATTMRTTGLCPPLYAHYTAPVMPFATPVRSSSSSAAFTMSPEMDFSAKQAADRARTVSQSMRGFWRASNQDQEQDQEREQHQEQDQENDLESDEEADDYEERKVLTKSVSCFLGHEVRERLPMRRYEGNNNNNNSSSASHQFAAAFQTRASERDAAVQLAAEAWAARIEIAGIPNVEALRRRKSQSQSPHQARTRAMLVQQSASPSSSAAAFASMTRKTSHSSATLVTTMKDRGDHARRECLT